MDNILLESVGGVLHFSPLEVRLNLHSLEGFSLHPLYRVSSSNYISALCLYIWTPHPESTSSQAVIRLWGMYSTLKTFLAALGSVFNINSRVYVVTISALFGVPGILFFSCSSDILTCAPRPISEYDTDESMNAVVLLGLGGLVQPGRLSSLRILKLLKTRLFPAGASCHFPYGALPKPVFAVLPPIVFCLVASSM